MLLVNKALWRVAGSATTFMTLLAKLAQNVLITARKWSLGQGNIFTPVCHSIHSGGSASVHAGIPPPPPGTRYTPPGTSHTPRTRHTPRDHAPPGTRHTHPTPIPLGTDTPPDQAHTPRDQGDTVNARAVRIPLECSLVFSVIPSETVLAPSRRTGCESKKHQAHPLWHTRLKSISPLKCTEERKRKAPHSSTVQLNSKLTEIPVKLMRNRKSFHWGAYFPLGNRMWFQFQWPPTEVTGVGGVV